MPKSFRILDCISSISHSAARLRVKTKLGCFAKWAKEFRAMNKPTSNNPASFLRIALLALFIVSCSTHSEQTEPQNISPETPLSEFIIGRWKYEGKYYYEGYGYSDIFWEYTFVDENIIKIWTGNDGGTCSYSFIESEVISIDCSPRTAELMKWSVKRDSQFLLIQRLKTDNLEDGEQLQFERVEGR